MAADESDPRLTGDPAALRRAMADTRAAIDARLQDLADRAADLSPPNRRTRMATKTKAKPAAQPKPAAATAKKKPAAKAKRSAKPGPVRKAVSAAASEAKEVLGDVLAGAASGAVAGAAEALSEHTDEAVTAVNKLADQKPAAKGKAKKK